MKGLKQKQVYFIFIFILIISKSTTHGRNRKTHQNEQWEGLFNIKP